MAAASEDSSALSYAAFPGSGPRTSTTSLSPQPFQPVFLPFYQENPNTICFPRDSAPKVLWDNDPQTTAWFPNQKWVKPKSRRDLLQTSLCKSQAKLLWFAKQVRNLSAAPSFLENPCPASLSPQIGICTSPALICIAGTARKIKQDQSLLLLGVV